MKEILKILVVVMVFCHSIISFGQTINNKDSITKSITEICFSPAYYYSNLKQSTFIKNNFIWGYNVGTLRSRAISKMFSLQYGLNLCNFRSKGIIADSNVSIVGVANKTYINIPIELKYKYSMGKFKFSLNCGLLSYILINSRYKYSYFKNNDLENKTINNINIFNTSNYFKIQTSFDLSSIFGLGLDYQINKNLSLNIQPELSLNLLRNRFLFYPIERPAEFCSFSIYYVILRK